MVVKQAFDGAKGFDVNQPLTATAAVNFKADGNYFCIRYIPRTSDLIKGNLTKNEIGIILNAGLSLMAVQHVPLPNWKPTAELGTQYGQYAAEYSKGIGLPAGINIWLDLEEVNAASTPEEVTEYCENWYHVVLAAGYVPGLYVGYGCGLTPDQLYKSLSFKNYWRAYNGSDVSVRGFQILQHTQQQLNGIFYDPNVIQNDKIGDLPMWLSPS